MGMSLAPGMRPASHSHCSRTSMSSVPFPTAAWASSGVKSGTSGCFNPPRSAIAEPPNLCDLFYAERNQSRGAGGHSNADAKDKHCEQALEQPRIQRPRDGSPGEAARGATYQEDDSDPPVDRRGTAAAMPQHERPEETGQAIEPDDEQRRRYRSAHRHAEKQHEHRYDQEAAADPQKTGQKSEQHSHDDGEPPISLVAGCRFIGLRPEHGG